MPKRVLIIGGYGNFGSYIARRLAPNPDLRLIIAGRSKRRANHFADNLPAANEAAATAFDIRGKLDRALEVLAPEIVIHTSGPYQDQSHFVAAACIRRGCHYIDLADARDFVCSAGKLDDAARAAGVSVISGASSVPTLSSAVIDRYLSGFARLETVDYGIAAAQLTSRGLATTRAGLTYAGKPFTTLEDGDMHTVYGWHDMISREFPGLGKRWLANADVPDLSLFPQRYKSLHDLRFRAGIEVPFLQFSLYALSWLVRAKLVKNLARYAKPMQKAARLLDPVGSDKSGFYMHLTGKDKKGGRKEITFDLTAKSGDGPYIPCMPAILLTERLVAGADVPAGAMPCVGLITLDEYLAALEPMDISWTVTSVN